MSVIAVGLVLAWRLLPADRPGPSARRARLEVNWHATRAMLLSEARLLGRNPGVVRWTAVLPVAAAIILGSVPPCVSRPTASRSDASLAS